LHELNSVLLPLGGGGGGGGGGGPGGGPGANGGMTPLQRALPGSTTPQTACATAVGDASSLPGTACLKSSQKKPPACCFCVDPVIDASIAAVSGRSWPGSCSGSG